MVHVTRTFTFHGLAELAAPVMQREFQKLGNQTVDGVRRAVSTPPADS